MSLFASGAPLFVQNGITALMMAAMNGRTEVVKFLAAAGVDKNVLNYVST